MAETLNLWHETNSENAIFYIPFHPLMSLIPQSILRQEFEKVAIEVVNSVGVDINACVKYKHLRS